MVAMQKSSRNPKGFSDSLGLLELLDIPADLGGPQPAAPGAEGHRARMRLRLLTAGPDAVADHEM